MTNSEVLIYLAGYFDGKGCITVLANNGYPSLRISVQSTDPVAVKLFGEYFRTPSRDVTNAIGKQRINYRLERWSLDGQRAVEVLHQLVPYLKVNKEKADIALGADWKTSLADAVNRIDLLKRRKEVKKRLTRVVKKRDRVRGR